MSTVKITLDDLKLLIEQVISESSFNSKIFYHGRKDGRRPYHGNYIYISDSIEYAAGYSDGNKIYKFQIPFSEDKIFSLKNSKHVDILKTITDGQGFKNMFNTAGSGGEMDWTSLQYIYDDEYEGEEVLENLGFYGVKLNERPGVESILVFDQNKIKHVGYVDMNNPKIKQRIGKYFQDFEKKYNLL